MRALGFGLAGVMAPMLLFVAVALAMEVPWQVLALAAMAVTGAGALGLAVWWLGDRRRRE
jgi:hypothetical protein